MSVKPRVLFEHTDQATAQKHHGYEEHERKRDLADDEHAAQGKLTRRRRRAPTQHVDNTPSCRHKGRQRSTDQRTGRRDYRHDTNHPPTHRHLAARHTAELLQGKTAHGWCHPQREKHTTNDSHGDERLRLQQQLPRNLGTARAESAPHRQLAPSIDRSHDQEPRKIRKGDEHGERSSTREKAERSRRVACYRRDDARRDNVCRR